MRMESWSELRALSVSQMRLAAIEMSAFVIMGKVGWFEW